MWAGATHFQSALHLFDGHGALVKKVAGGVTTIYIGAHYEKNITTGVATSYYYAGGTRVALRQGGVVYYLLGDHLSSTVKVLNGSGAWVGELRYKPYGETRYTWGTTPTGFRYTGQRQEESLGLYQMGARWVDPALARWLSADTLVPEGGNPQAFNRYSYVLGNPLRYIDPSGHWDKEWEEQFEEEHGRPPTEQDWWDYQFSLQIENWIAACWEQTYQLRTLLWGADVTIKADDIKWTIAQVERVGEAVKHIAGRFGGDVRRFIGGITVIMQTEVKPWWTKIMDPNGNYGGYEYRGKLYMEPDTNLAAIVHEMGHYWAEKDDLLSDYWGQVRAFMIIPDRSEDFAEAFRFYVLTVTSWPPPGNWNCSSQGCKYPIDLTRYNYFEGYREQ